MNRSNEIWVTACSVMFLVMSAVYIMTIFVYFLDQREELKLIEISHLHNFIKTMMEHVFLLPCKETLTNKAHSLPPAL